MSKSTPLDSPEKASASKPVAVAFFASGRGSNMQAVLEAWKCGRLNIQPVLLVTNNPKAGAVEYARLEGIPVAVLNAHRIPDPVQLDQSIVAALTEHGAELVVLAGYTKKIGPSVLDRFRERILNIHPALLPKFGGHGMYGSKVHEAVLAAKESVSGATVHLVNEIYDDGRILGQREVPVRPDDSVESLAARVLEAEHALFVDTLAQFLDELQDPKLAL